MPNYLPQTLRGYLGFVPFEDDYAVWPQHAKSLFKTCAQVIAPDIFVQATVFLNHPSVFAHSFKMRLVKHDNGERGLSERQRAKVGDNVRADNQAAPVAQVCCSE
ncbi:TPA: hypothetical protein NBP60_004938 [Klebsiella pneumoniae]|nr:hypothetical protein [Klebsiella pneumoniae]HBQ3206417.1 hypothetical protein [Klebsiella pneumoniae]HBQ6657674.1 hypothetical protein [Klebsiella pneumoniae]HCD3294075.1 hypothetical protein [Klebsiella pneumoniae]HCD4054518.1 hypothetical protein [Klebsiella pneumoniae]